MTKSSTAFILWLRRVRGALIALASLTALAPWCAAAGETTRVEMTVSGLKKQGWMVTARSERIERRPGLPPYEALTRVVSVTTYTLVSGDQTVVCEIAYDSQRDSIEEHCQ